MADLRRKMTLSFLKNNIKNKFLQHGVFAKHSLILFLGTVLVSFFNYVFHFVIGRLVSVKVYGEAESLISFIAIISVFSTTLAMAATRYVAKCKVEENKDGCREIRNYLNKKVLKYGLPIFLVAVIWTPLVGNFLNIENNFSLVLIWFLMLLSFFSAVNSGVFSGWQKFRYTSLTGVLGAIAKLISGIILVKIGFALNGIVGSFVIASVIAYFASTMIIKYVILKKKDDGEKICDIAVDFQSIKRYILPVFVGNLAIAIMCNIDMILAKHNLDAITAGQYGALNVTSKIIFFGTGIIASVLFSMSAERSHKGNSAKPILKIALALVSLASFVATIIYFFYPKLILSILYGSKYQEVSSHLGWFAIAVSLFSIANVIFQYLLSIHKTKISYALIVVAAALMGLLFLYGSSIAAIITIVIFTQLIAITMGVFYLFQKEKKYWK